MAGFKLSGRLLRGVEYFEVAWKIETDIWSRFSHSIVFVLNILYLLRIFFNCAFYAFYEENHGLEVPRETRLEKLMRVLEVLKKCMEKKPSCQRKPFWGCTSGLSRKWKKSR